MNREKAGKRARLITILAGTIILLALVPWLVSFIPYLRDTLLTGKLDVAAQEWLQTGYFANYWATITNKSMLIGSGLVFALFEIGLVVYLAPQAMFKPSGKSMGGDKWGPPAAGNGEYGNARWQTQPEMDKTTYVWDTATKPQKGGIVLGVDMKAGKEKYYLSSDDTHTMVIGTTRSGKTRRTILPTIWALAQAEESMVLTDPKGELYLSTKEYLKEQGYEVIAMNYREPEKSAYWNPLSKVLECIKNDNMSSAEQTARVISESLVNSTQSKSNDSFWQNTAKSVLTAITMFLAIEAPSDDQKHLYNANYILGQYGKPVGYDDRVPLTELIDALAVDHPARRAWYTAGIAGDKTRSSIFANALTAIQLLADRKIGYITSRQDHDLKQVGIKKTAVFLIIPDEDTTYNVLATIYVNQLYQTLIELANEHGGRLPRRVNFLLDEFGNMPPIPDFDKKLTVAGGRGMRFTIAVQALDQLDKLYDKAANTIKGNCHTWIYLLTADVKTAEEIEKKLGKYTIATASSGMSAQYGGPSLKPSASHNTNLTGRSLLMATDLMQWKSEDGAIVIRLRDYPARFPTPELSQLRASTDYGMGNPQQTAAMIQKRDNELPVKEIRTPKVWTIDLTKELKSKYKQDQQMEGEEIVDQTPAQQAPAPSTSEVPPVAQAINRFALATSANMQNQVKVEAADNEPNAQPDGNDDFMTVAPPTRPKKMSINTP